MDISTLQIVIHKLHMQHEQAYERYNLHPNDPYCEGKVIGAYEALARVEALLREELEYRDARTA